MIKIVASYKANRFTKHILTQRLGRIKEFNGEHAVWDNQGPNKSWIVVPLSWLGHIKAIERGFGDLLSAHILAETIEKYPFLKDGGKMPLKRQSPRKLACKMPKWFLKKTNWQNGDIHWNLIFWFLEIKPRHGIASMDWIGVPWKKIGVSAKEMKRRSWLINEFGIRRVK